MDRARLSRPAGRGRLLARTGLACALLAAALPCRPGETGVAARVDGVPIHAERARRFFEDHLAERGRTAAGIRSPAAYQALWRESLERLIEAELLWQEAQRQKIFAAKAEVDAALAEVRTRFAAPGAFERRLVRGGFTLESYAEYLRQQLSIRKLVQERIAAHLSVSDAEVEAHRTSNPERFAGLAPGGGPVPEADVRRAIREALLAEKAREALAREVEALRARARVEVAGEARRER